MIVEAISALAVASVAVVRERRSERTRQADALAAGKEDAAKVTVRYREDTKSDKCYVDVINGTDIPIGNISVTLSEAFIIWKWHAGDTIDFVGAGQAKSLEGSWTFLRVSDCDFALGIEWSDVHGRRWRRRANGMPALMSQR